MLFHVTFLWSWFLLLLMFWCTKFFGLIIIAPQSIATSAYNTYKILVIYKLCAAYGALLPPLCCCTSTIIVNCTWIDETAILLLNVKWMRRTVPIRMDKIQRYNDVHRQRQGEMIYSLNELNVSRSHFWFRLRFLNGIYVFRPTTMEKDKCTWCVHFRLFVPSE